MFEEESFIIKEKSCIVTSNKNIEYKIIFSIYNNDTVKLTIYTTNNIPQKKFNLSCTLEELLKNRFFKLFNNVDEVFRELENRIENSTIIEETNAIFLDIPIGLNIIKDIILEIKQTEKTKEEINEELTYEINKLKNENSQLQLKLKNVENELNDTKQKLKSKNIENEIKINEEENLDLNKNAKKINEKENLELIDELFDNIIEIEINSYDDGENIKIINDNFFNKENIK